MAVPQLQAYVGRVKTLLKRYVALADGRIDLKIINVEAFSEEEDQAASFGMQAVPVNKRGGKVYFGVVFTDSVDSQTEISFFDPAAEVMLEYELTRSIYDLANADETKVGILSWLPERQNAGCWCRAAIGLVFIQNFLANILLLSS